MGYPAGASESGLPGGGKSEKKGRGVVPNRVIGIEWHPQNSLPFGMEDLEARRVLDLSVMPPQDGHTQSSQWLPEGCGWSTKQRFPHANARRAATPAEGWRRQKGGREKASPGFSDARLQA